MSRTMQMAQGGYASAPTPPPMQQHHSDPCQYLFPLLCRARFVNRAHPLYHVVASLCHPAPVSEIRTALISPPPQHAQLPPTQPYYPQQPQHQQSYEHQHPPPQPTPSPYYQPQPVQYPTPPPQQPYPYGQPPAQQQQQHGYADPYQQQQMPAPPAFPGGYR